MFLWLKCCYIPVTIFWSCILIRKKAQNTKLWCFPDKTNKRAKNNKWRKDETERDRNHLRENNNNHNSKHTRKTFSKSTVSGSDLKQADQSPSRVQGGSVAWWLVRYTFDTRYMYSSLLFSCFSGKKVNATDLVYWSWLFYFFLFI